MNCPKCNREVNPQAAFCPHCGSPLNQQPVYYEQRPKKNTGLIIACSILGLLLAVAIGFGVNMYLTNNEKEKADLEQRAQEAEAKAEIKDTVVVEKVKEVKVREHVEPANPSIVHIKGNVVNVRDSPSLHGSVIGTVYKGEDLTYYATEGDWYAVNYYGSWGYIRKYHTNGKRIAVAR